MAEDQQFLREMQKEFLEELQFLLEACEESYLKIENADVRVEELAKIFRLAHSIKGAGATVGYNDLASFAHLLEDCLAILRMYPQLVDTEAVSILLKCGDAIKARALMLKEDAPAEWDITALKQELSVYIEHLQKRVDEKPEPEVTAAPPAPSSDPEDVHLPRHRATDAATIKVDSHRVESILDIVGELVVLKSQILNETFRSSPSPRLNSVVTLLDKTIRELQERTLGMRLAPLKGLFLKTQRVARDLSVRLNKPVEFHIEGGEIEVDRNLIEQLSDPLMHLIRNCLDHGIEAAAVRQERGKPEKGSISVTAQQSGGRVVILVSDDGNGIHRSKIVLKAIEAGLLPAAVEEASLSDSEVFELLFAPGFSTAEKVTEVSGRGVGMNVVRENIEQLKGRVEVKSEPGKGSCFKISIPMMTSITDGMLVSIDGQTYILPMSGIRELVDLKESGLVPMHDSGPLFNIRGKFFPLLRLGQHLQSRYHGPTASLQNPSTYKEMIVVFEHETGMVALEVDSVLGQAQVVMKPLQKGIQDNEGIAGAAILGDGKVALLLDISSMVA